ncbi:MAG: HupE/UreJ family protein [Vicinamibacterales bacterium]
MFQVDAHRVTQLARAAEDLDDLSTVLVRHLAEAIRVRQEGRACATSSTRKLSTEPGVLRIELGFTCPRELGISEAEIEFDAFRSVSPGHVHYSRLAQPDRPVHEAVLAGAKATLRIGGAARPAPDQFLAFLTIGLEHVLSGLDHLAFLIALILLAGRSSSAAWAATGFTIGHSVTLGLVAFGWLRPQTATIEALIGFTIAFTAARVPGDPERWKARSRVVWPLAVSGAIATLPAIAHVLGFSTPPWPVYAGAALFCLGFGVQKPEANTPAALAVLLAIAFGLVHGAGFAGGLLELDLPRDRLLGALIGFNVGVELAQLLVLGACAALVAAARGLPRGWTALGRHVTCAALLGLGVYWFIARSLQ